MARRDDIDNFISNPDGISKYDHCYSKKVYDNDNPKFVKEESSSSKTIRENVRVEEKQRVEKIQHSTLSRPQSIIRKPDITFSISNAVAAVGSTAAAVAVTVVVAVVIVVAALSLTVSLVSATSSTLSFFVDIQNEEGKTFTATLSQGDWSVVYDLTASDYLTFSDLTPDSEYNLRIIDKESGEEYYNQNFCTLKEDNDRVKIVSSFSGDSVLTFTLTIDDLRRDEFYTVEVTDATGKTYLVIDSTETPKAFEIQMDDVPDAYITISINGRYALLEKVTKVHIFGEPIFNWTETDDGYSATAVFADVDDSTFTNQVVATVTPSKTMPTCEEDGQIVYTASVDFEDKTYTDTKIITLTAFGHDYKAVFNWASDDQGAPTATVTLICQHDQNHVVDGLAPEISEQVIEATCEEGSSATYTATVTYEGTTYTDTNTISTGAALGHSYGEPEWEWTDSGTVDEEGIPVYTAVAVFTCSRCGDTMRMNGGDYSYESGLATCEAPGTVVLYARVTYNDQEYEDTHELSFPATGHDYGEPQWTWNELGDGDWTATLKFVCANDPEHIQTPEVTITPSSTPATCEESGTITYTASAMFDGVEYTDEKSVEGETAHGHDYSGEPEWEWTDTSDVDDEGFPIYQAVAVFTCKNDATHVERVVCQDENLSHEGELPGCEGSGMITYYASIDFNNNYQDEHEVMLDPLGHSYIPVFSWIQYQDAYQAELYIVCERGDSHFGPITAVVTTSTQIGYTLYTATATYDNTEYTETKKVVDESTDKELAVGVNYYIGDTMKMGGETVYFYDDYAGGAHRTDMSGSTPLTGVLLAGDNGGASFTYTDISDYDRIILENQLYARMEDGEYGGYHGSSEETSWRFTASDDNLIGVTITSGTGTKNDPYVLAPVYGAKVIYNANGGMFRSNEAYSLTRYSAGDSNYVIPPAENPEQGGMLFLGWFTDDSGQNKFDFENTPITEDIILYAGWVAIE